jgi:thiol:disulfide interchange protein DsbD
MSLQGSSGRLLRAVLLALAACFLSATGAAAQPDSNWVEGTKSVAPTIVLARTGVAPGGSLQLALRLEHAPGWNTFWYNPGGGEATKINWTLPEGWSAADIKWPAPEPVLGKDGALFGHGYSGTLYLPVEIKAPANIGIGDRVRLQASVSWLACRAENCVNGSASLELDTSVIHSPAPIPAVIAALDRQVKPEWQKHWVLSATKSGEEVIFRLKTGEPVVSPHFFPATEMIWYSAEQRYETAGGGELVGRLPLDPFYSGESTALSGVLTFTDVSGRRRAISVRAPFSPVTAASDKAAGGAAAGETRTTPLLKILAMAFLGGLILNLMPCILPILSMKVLSLAQSSRAGATAFRADAVAYTLGVLTSFLAAGALMLVLRASLGELGWGFQLQQPAFVLALALLMTAVGFNLLGVLQVGGSLQGLGNSLTEGNSRRASFFTGVLAVVVAAPCTAPFMASAMGAALVLPPAGALAIFLMLGLGLAFPYLLLSFLPVTHRILPKPGNWMVTFRQILAFPMFATAIWLLWVLGQQLGVGAMALGLIAIFTLSLGTWSLGKGRVAGRAFAVVCFFLTVAVVAQAARLPPPNPRGSDATDPSPEGIPYTPEALDALLASGKPAFVYFTADWCITCKVNEANAIRRPETAAFFKENNIAVMVGDWTRQDPHITAILKSYGRSGVPMYLFYPAGAKRMDGILLPQILTVGNVRAGIEPKIS